jgi:hypothetical protein
MDTPNIQLATTRMLEWTVSQLERYICCHGPRTFRRSVLRDLLHNRVQPVYPSVWQVFVVVAQTLYRHGHLWSVVQVLQFEGFIPFPPGQSNWTLLEMPWVGRWLTPEEWVLGGRAPNFFLPMNLWHDPVLISS